MTRYIAFSALPDDARRERTDDMRGWELREEQGGSVGRVRDVILLDGAPAMLDVTAGRLLSPRRVLVPLSDVHVDVARETIVVSRAVRERIEHRPEYDGDLSALDGSPAHRPSDAATVTRSEEELALGVRETQIGEVVVRKTVDVERVRVPAERSRDDVSTERRPATDERAARGLPYEVGDELHIPIVEEEVVVQTRQVVREVLVVRRRRVRETVEVEADLRKERVDVEQRALDGTSEGPSA